jgi:hypothetical protein
MASVSRPGRNDPCPCGSAAKYKQCCLAAAHRQADSDPATLVWQRLRRANEGFPQTMAAFLGNTYGKGAINEAWAEFTLWTEEVFDPDSPHVPLFLPWSYHHWSPDPLEQTGVEDETLHGRTPTSLFLERRGHRIDPAMRRYLEACLEAPLSFHEILRCDPERGFRTRDIIAGTECDVLERSASRSVRPGDILFAQIVAVDGIHMLEACPQIIIQPIDKIHVVELRRAISRNPVLELFPAQTLRDYDMELRELYLDLTDPDATASTPELRNTDGERLALQRLTWEIESAGQALEALRHLALDDADSITVDEGGRCSLPWLKRGNRQHKSWNNTVLGHIEIAPSRLVAQVNSDERAAKLRSIVTKVMGKAARFRMAESVSGDDAPLSPATFEPGNEPPEIREALNRMLATHYDNWHTEPLPALGNRSPQEAVQDADGREKVAALLAQIERDTARSMPSADQDILQHVRARLGL